MDLKQIPITRRKDKPITGICSDARLKNETVILHMANYSRTERTLIDCVVTRPSDQKLKNPVRVAWDAVHISERTNEIINEVIDSTFATRVPLETGNQQMFQQKRNVAIL